MHTAAAQVNCLQPRVHEDEMRVAWGRWLFAARKEGDSASSVALALFRSLTLGVAIMVVLLPAPWVGTYRAIIDTIIDTIVYCLD